MKQKTLINFVNHYSSCPICNGNLVINTDLSIPSTVDKTKDGLLITIYEDEKDTLELRLNYSNTIKSSRPFILSTPYHILRRHLSSTPPDTYDTIQLESSCIDCGNFKYYSAHITMDRDTETMGQVEVRSERAELKHEDDHLILSNNLKKEELFVHTPNGKNHLQLPFVGTLKELELKDTKKLILKIKKQLLVS
jgi:hypothetical protein